MSDTLPDVSLVMTQYKNVYTETGISPGTAVVVQNKSAHSCWLQISTNQPAAESEDGTLLFTGEFVLITGSISGLWAKGNGKISVQLNS
jgi:hypothetical protein